MRKAMTIETLEARIAPATFTVTSFLDSGAGSLREAITEANASPGADKIVFKIPGAGPHTIALDSQLPPITEPVKILGNTQPGYKKAPLIALDGSATGGGATGLWLTTHSGSQVRALSIHGFDGSGIFVTLGGDHKIRGNFIGLTPTGTADGNGTGIWISLFSEDNLIGGTKKNHGNVIAGNTGDGIFLSQSPGTRVLGNTIGLLPNGVFPSGNGGGGISVSNAEGTIIGGPEPGAGNLIAANSGRGISISGTSTGTVVAGNLIGTDKTATVAFANGLGGVYIGPGTGDNIIGGNTKAHANIISGNGSYGIQVFGSDDNTIRGNLIGTGKVAIFPLGNSGPGISLESGATGNAVFKNTIAHNGADGIAVVGLGSIENILSRNRIASNAGLGIDLANDGVTPNDAGDGDPGPNALLNYPVLASAKLLASGTTKVQGTLDAPAGTVRIEFYRADNDPTGFGEGPKYLGFAVVTTDGINPVAFTFKTGALKKNQLVTAIAIATSGDTSEFAQNATVAK